MLRDNYQISRFLDPIDRRREYFDLIAALSASLTAFLLFEPGPMLLRRALACVIVERNDFLTFLRTNGAVDKLCDAQALADLAEAGAGTFVAQYLHEVGS